MERKLFKIMAVLMAVVFGVAGVCLAETKTWAPYRGSSEVNQSYTFQTMIFSVAAIKEYPSNGAYEHEVQIWNKQFADYNGYWSSNLPNPYLDTQKFDYWPFANNEVDNFAVGSFTASKISAEKAYYTNMGLKKTTANSILNAKIKANSSVRIKGQKAKLIVPGLYNAWNVFSINGQTTQDPPLYKNSSAEHKPVCWQYR